MTPLAPLPDAAALRLRSAGLMEIAASADRAAARFSARALAVTADPEATAISVALAQVAQSHRDAGSSLAWYAGELDEATQRRLALDQLVDAARQGPGADHRVVDQVETLRDDLVARLDVELREAAERCAASLAEATPTTAAAADVANAIALALAHARARLLELAGPADA